MQKCLIYLFLLVHITGFAQSGELLWSDEFNYEGHPDPQKWRYEEGFVRHREAQYYTKNRYENAHVADGNLVITACKEEPLRLIRKTGGSQFKFITSDSGGEYTSASLNTEDKFEFTYGRVEVRARIPAGRGVWPAIWTLGTDLGWGPGDSTRNYSEIDIMEYVGHDPQTIHANVHPGFSGGSRGGKVTLERPWEDFHVYALEWYPDRLDFFFDGKKYFSYLKDDFPAERWAYDRPQYLIINLAIGGEWGAVQGIDDSIFPVQFLIDYVRVYSLN